MNSAGSGRCRRAFGRVATRFLFLLGLTMLSPPGNAADVLTYHNDNARTGLNPNEFKLTPSNVRVGTFGLRLNLPVDGKVDAQPLYVSNTPVYAGGNFAGNHDLIIVATEHDSVYAFDAVTGTLYWHDVLLGAGETPSDPRGCGQVTPEIGITATPVIDRTNGSAGANGTIYVVAMSKTAKSVYYQRLYALDLSTGRTARVANVQATYPGNGPNNDGHGHVIFDPAQYKERASLLLLNGIVYTAWSSHCDIPEYTGWIIGYDEKTLAQRTALNIDPNGSASGNSFWGSGAGPAADAAGNIYALSANGPFDTTLTGAGFPNQGDYGDTFLKLSTNAGLRVSDYFTPFDQAKDAAQDIDLASGGAVVLPDMVDAGGATRRLAIGAGKDTNIYLVNRDNMGRFIPGATSNSNIYQELAGALPGGEFATAAYFNGSVYYGPVGGALRRFTFHQARLNPGPAAMTSTRFAYPGTTPSISAAGNNSGIVWAYENPSSGNQAILHAYDARSLAELYNSSQNPARDSFGAANKFITPTICNGEVLVATTNSVAVFGSLATPIQAAVDLNGDGHSDVVWFNPITNQVSVWLMNGNNILAHPILGSAPPNGQIVAVGNLNRNGNPQIIWYTGSKTYIAWSTTWSGYHPTTTATSFSLPTNYPTLAIADFDGDGFQDVVQWDPSSSKLSIAKNNGSLNFTQQYSVVVLPNWGLVGVADLNGDGHHELVWRNRVTRHVGAWVMNRFQPARWVGYDSPALSWRIRGIGKVDASNAQGLIWRNEQTGQTSSWKLNTNGQVTHAVLPTGASPWEIEGAPYFDGMNGLPEILWYNTQTGSVSVWRVRGTSITPSVVAVPGTQWTIQPAVNGD
jgi:hypothetical protein